MSRKKGSGFVSDRQRKKVMGDLKGREHRKQYDDYSTTYRPYGDSSKLVNVTDTEGKHISDASSVSDAKRKSKKVLKNKKIGSRTIITKEVGEVEKVKLRKKPSRSKKKQKRKKIRLW